MENSGFSVHNRTTVYPDDAQGLHKLARYLMRAPVKLIYRVYEVDPLSCPRCGDEMKVLALITDYEVIRRILDHPG